MNNSASTVKIREAHGKFQEFLKSKKRASATILAYGKDIDQLITFLEELKKEHIKDVTNSDIEAFLAHLQGKGYTPKSLSRKLNSTRTFYRFLKVNEYVTDDPSLMVAHPKYELTPPRILTPLEYRALRDAASVDPRIYAIIEVLLQTGIRIGELAALRMEDVEENTLHIAPYEGHAARDVQMNRRAKEALKRYLSVRPNTADVHVFVTKTGKPFLVRNIRDAVERYFRKAGIENAKINDLRHTFVAHHLRNGVSLVFLSKVLGHKRLSSTERYLQYIKDAKNTDSTTLLEL
ncbi:MAG: tyrosine-type recombinase/integrase [Candidatus Levyibacteriota bacterium]